MKEITVENWEECSSQGFEVHDCQNFHFLFICSSIRTSMWLCNLLGLVALDLQV